MIQKIKYHVAFPVAFLAILVLLWTVWFVRGRAAAMEVVERL